MASSIDNAFITQYGRRKPKMAQKRTRKPIPVPSHEELMEGRKKLKPYRPKPKPKKDKEKEWKGIPDESHRIPKPKPKKKKPKIRDLIYRGEPLGSGKSSQEV